ncbi:hypothetical protein SAMN00120144_2311 [Hymenobacter roseosalivarius DSM 11622]|uniref:Lipoprotein n=1 Tax=Hymenobacter roseosalivarius DSM 11622 TaxID=645990 RepID=A0A1W1VX89_9BACT|nr:hypothetical protein SAMN00120144_2311 [Hymenobacter roseosalivarius DSM 11622]
MKRRRGFVCCALLFTACVRNAVPDTKIQAELGRVEFVKSCIRTWSYFQLDQDVELTVIHFNGGGFIHTGRGANPAMLIGVTATGDSIRVMSKSTGTLKWRGNHSYQGLYDKRIRTGAKLLIQPDLTVPPNEDSSYPWFPMLSVSSDNGVNNLNCSVTRTCFGKIQFLTSNKGRI